jgi:hypothetical protein
LQLQKIKCFHSNNKKTLSQPRKNALPAKKTLSQPKKNALSLPGQHNALPGHEDARSQAQKKALLCRLLATINAIILDLNKITVAA